MKYLITGMAGFIGFHLAKKLIDEGNIVVGLDNLNNYYDVQLKYARLNELGINSNELRWNEEAESNTLANLCFFRLNLEDKSEIFQLFENEQFDIVVNLAAQAGVRYSIDNPDVYIQSNIVGFINILEACRYFPVKHLFYASSSSVYGNNQKVPFSEDDYVDHPISLYAATKKSNELMANSYSHLYNIPTTGLRFFTVYGPWGRPDMALFKFTKAILNQESIEVYNKGLLERDFTYIDDIIHGILGLIKIASTHQKSTQYNIYNIGNNKPVLLLDFISELEKNLKLKANIQFKPMQPGDVLITYADISKIQEICGYNPETNIQVGIKQFCEWYIGFYKSKS